MCGFGSVTSVVCHCRSIRTLFYMGPECLHREGEVELDQIRNNHLDIHMSLNNSETVLSNWIRAKARRGEARPVFHFHYDTVASPVVRFAGRPTHRGGPAEALATISVTKTIPDVSEYDNAVASNRAGERERERVRVRWKLVRWGAFFLFPCCALVCRRIFHVECSTLGWKRGE